MTRTRYYTATTIDGFLADTDNSLGWLFEVESDGADKFGPFMADVGAFAMGSTTYEWVVAHENLVDKPEKWRRWYGDRQCWVFTHRDLPTLGAGAPLLPRRLTSSQLTLSSVEQVGQFAYLTYQVRQP